MVLLLWVKGGKHYIGIITERDRNGNITGLKQMEIPELTDFLEKSWKEK